MSCPSAHQVHALVMARLGASVPPELICQELCIVSCISDDTAYDNVTAMLVLLPSPPAHAPAALEGAQQQQQLQADSGLAPPPPPPLHRRRRRPQAAGSGAGRRFDAGGAAVGDEGGSSDDSSGGSSSTTGMASSSSGDDTDDAGDDGAEAAGGWGDGMVEAVRRASPRKGPAAAMLPGGLEPCSLSGGGSGSSGSSTADEMDGQGPSPRGCGSKSSRGGRQAVPHPCMAWTTGGRQGDA